jgi:DNA-directed RNA polymerase specialized sigma24 family protein
MSAGGDRALPDPDRSLPAQVLRAIREREFPPLITARVSHTWILPRQARAGVSALTLGCRTAISMRIGPTGLSYSWGMTSVSGLTSFTGGGVFDMPMTGAEPPGVPDGRHGGRQARGGFARSLAHRQPAWTLAGMGPAAAVMPVSLGRDYLPGRDADQAVTVFYHTHYRSLVRIAALLTGDAKIAEEIVQDAFVSMHRGWRFMQDGDEALRQLRRAVVTAARSRRTAVCDAPLLPAGPAGTGQPAPGVPWGIFMAALSLLPDRQREALVLKYYADWPEPVIAAAMGISRRALSACVQRGISAFQGTARS